MSFADRSLEGIKEKGYKMGFHSVLDAREGSWQLKMIPGAKI